MSRSQAGQRHAASHTGRLVGTFVAFALSLAAVIAMPQAAQAADVVTVPDANLKAVLNSAIGTATSTTRTPDQDITPADALTVTTIDTGVVEDAPIATLTGLEAFTNVTSLLITRPGSTATDLRPIGSLTSLTTLQMDNMPFTSLDGLGSLARLNNLRMAGASQLVDLSALSQLTQLTNFIVGTSPRVRDLSPLSGSKDTLLRVTVTDAAVEDISFLEGFKKVRNLSFIRNRIEDVSVFGTFDDSYALNDAKANQLALTGNRIKDFSPVVAFRAIKGLNFGPTAATSGQSIYVGPYDAVNGVTVPLKSGPNNNNSNPPATPSIAAGTGTYDAATGLLTSADPAATFVTVSPNWTINFSEAPDKIAALKINEVESNGDAVNGDWVELYNPASTTVDVSGLVIADNDDAHTMTVPTGTKIPAKGYQAIVTENAAKVGPFGLGGADSVRIFAPGTTDLTTVTPIDSYTWTEHATTTYGRTVPGAGRWALTDAGSFGTLNTFSTAATVSVAGDATSITGSAALTATVAKPGSTEVATDATGTVVFAVDGKDVSGPVEVMDGTATYTATGLTGSPTGIAHQVTARYVAEGESDPYDSSAPSAEFTVTVTIGEFAGDVTLSTTTPVMCETITSDVSGITPVPDSVTYQWQERRFAGGTWSNLSASTGSSHALQFTVADGQIVAPVDVARRLVATVSKTGYATKTLTSVETSNVARASYLTTPAATLSTSTPKVGETITATHPKWTSCIPPEFNFEIGYDYQWLRDGQPIAGASDASVNGIGGAGPKQVSYTVTPGDAGHKISLRVFGNSPGMTYDRADSAETSVVTAGAFATSPAPVVDNVSPKVGDVVKASTAAWSPVATMAYQWLRDGAPITGATSAAYTTTAADADHALSVRATGTAEGYAATEKTSAATAKVARLAFTGSPAPVVAGGTTVGDTLTATVAAWSPVASFTWQWLRDGQPIAGATSASYTTTAADEGHAISVRVTGSADGYGAESKTSAATPQVAARPVPAPGVTQVAKKVSSKYAVKVTAQSGKKLRLAVSARNVPASAIDTRITVKIAGVKGSYKVTVKNGKGTIALGSKAKKLKKGQKVTVTVSLTKLTSKATSTAGTTVTTTTYAVAKATKKVKVRLK
jgi:hypothetical protein